MSSTAPQLVVGLGNPGDQYAQTRHNAGFWWIDALARRHGGLLRSDSRFHGEVGEVHLRGFPALRLLKPQTYMNRSGQAIGILARFFRIPPERILVVHDELDLPPGTARLKKGGGHGGHNGLRDTIAHLGSQAFGRLRLGIGHPGQREAVVGYVLQRPTRQDSDAIEAALDDSLDCLELLLADQWQKAMNQLHRRHSTPNS